MKPYPLRIGIDIGGTFTDFVVFHTETGELESFKLLSTPEDPSQAVLQGLNQISALSEMPSQIIHGSTVATNALLERKGARTALVTTEGFGDVLHIGRQNRPALYDLFTDPPEPLAPPHLRFEVRERITAEGEVLVPLQASEIDALLPALRDNQVESVAVCTLFSFLKPEHEAWIARRLRGAGYFVSVSSEIAPEFREYERMSTTVINAYVSPVLDRYLQHLQTALAQHQQPIALAVMQSNGGSISVNEARRFGVRCILSGPAGGVTAAQLCAGILAENGPGQAKLITFDMGGTSTDVSLIDGAPHTTTEAEIGGLPIRIPLLDIHTIGAGGGSIAAPDLGGALRVGPQSAGADPGPACYGRIDPQAHPDKVVATVTDANLVLGRLDPATFLGGQMQLKPDYAHFALERLGRQLGLNPITTALGVIAVANAHMERALRVISVARGFDPRDFSLLSFGGAGGLHAGELARRLGIPRVLAPPMASTLSALGMLAADTMKDYTQTVMMTAGAPNSEIATRLAPMLAKAQADLLQEGFTPREIQLLPSLDMRYRGQSFELNISYRMGGDFLADFHTAHLQAYGAHRPQARPDEIEIVNLRLRAFGKIIPPVLPDYPAATSDPYEAYLFTRPVFFASEEPLPTPFLRGELLRPGNRITGPAVIVRSDTTILLGGGDQAEVDRYLHLVIRI
jgi:N-methylhydantoinase A